MKTRYSVRRCVCSGGGGATYSIRILVGVVGKGAPIDRRTMRLKVEKSMNSRMSPSCLPFRQSLESCSQYKSMYTMHPILSEVVSCWDSSKVRYTLGTCESLPALDVGRYSNERLAVSASILWQQQVPVPCTM